MRTKIARHAVLVIAVILSGLAVAALPSSGAQAQGTCNLPAQYQGSASFGASVTSAAPGSTITFSGSGWPANASIPISVNGASVGSATADASGHFSFTYTVPSSATGTLSASAACGSFVLSASVSISGTVTSVTVVTTNGGTSLPVTGSPAIGLAQIALALLAAGGLVVLVSRRRSRTAES